jgi:1,6-anhydro-N-acetylmuramate kinase
MRVPKTNYQITRIQNYQISPRLFIGLMSGTSVDAIDAALVRITSTERVPRVCDDLGRRPVPHVPSPRPCTPSYQAKVLHHTEHAWPPKLRQRLLAIMAPASTTTEELCRLNVLVAQHFAAAVEKCLKESRIPQKKIIALGSHGQTICQLPPQSKIENRKSKIPSYRPQPAARPVNPLQVVDHRPRQNIRLYVHLVPRRQGA